MRKLAFVVPLAVVAIAFAAMGRPPVEQLVESQVRCGPNKICSGNKDDEWSVKSPIKLDGRGGAACDGGVSLCFTGKGTVVYDFPSLNGSQGGTLPTICTDSASGTATGCRFGDTLLMGVDQVRANGFGSLTPYLTAADTFVVEACAVGIADGGSFNMPDASYTVRCFR